MSSPIAFIESKLRLGDGVPKLKAVENENKLDSVPESPIDCDSFFRKGLTRLLDRWGR